MNQYRLPINAKPARFRGPFGVIKRLTATTSTGGSFSPTVVTPLGSTGMTQIVSSNTDDSYSNLGDIGFDLPMYNGNYRNDIYIGSNGYVTFGFGTTTFSSLSTTNPGRGLLVAATDRSYQQVFVNADNPGKAFRLRYEGSIGTGGTIGSPTMVWEVTLFVDGTIQLVTGVMNAVDGPSMITDGGGINYTAYTQAANTSKVFTRESATTYTVQTGSYSMS